MYTCYDGAQHIVRHRIKQAEEWEKTKDPRLHEKPPKHEKYFS